MDTNKLSKTNISSKAGLCPTCQGNKVLHNLGFIYKDCTACDATGRILIKRVILTEPLQSPQAAIPTNIDKRTKGYKALIRQQNEAKGNQEGGGRPLEK
jgi:hypothetical protein